VAVRQRFPFGLEASIVRHDGSRSDHADVTGSIDIMGTRVSRFFVAGEWV
jgi:hypothetical protein